MQTPGRGSEEIHPHCALQLKKEKNEMDADGESDDRPAMLGSGMGPQLCASTQSSGAPAGYVQALTTTNCLVCFGQRFHAIDTF